VEDITGESGGMGSEPRISLHYGGAQHREYLNMMDRIRCHWCCILDQKAAIDLTKYWDLLTTLWKADGPISKEEACKLMTSVKSAVTARKYLETAIQQEGLREVNHPKDARFRLVMLAPDVRVRLDAFFDVAVSELLDTNHMICQRIG
jgi:hypothetical protein